MGGWYKRGILTFLGFLGGAWYLAGFFFWYKVGGFLVCTRLTFNGDTLLTQVYEKINKPMVYEKINKPMAPKKTEICHRALHTLQQNNGSGESVQNLLICKMIQLLETKTDLNN